MWRLQRTFLEAPATVRDGRCSRTRPSAAGGGGAAAGSEDNVRSRIRTAPGDVNAKEWGQTHGRRVRAFPLGRAFRKVSLPCSRPPPPT